MDAASHQQQQQPAPHPDGCAGMMQRCNRYHPPSTVRMTSFPAVSATIFHHIILYSADLSFCGLFSREIESDVTLFLFKHWRKKRLFMDNKLSYLGSVDIDYIRKKLPLRKKMKKEIKRFFSSCQYSVVVVVVVVVMLVIQFVDSRTGGEKRRQRGVIDRPYLSSVIFWKWKKRKKKELTCKPM